jgi:hypothetical protein
MGRRAPAAVAMHSRSSLPELENVSVANRVTGLCWKPPTDSLGGVRHRRLAHCGPTAARYQVESRMAVQRSPASTVRGPVRSG